jgi:small-conductance mechanosensitive channel
MIRVVLEDEVFNRLSLPRGIPATISMLVRYSFITIGFFVAIAVAGISLDNLAIIVGAFSVGIGFGLQNIFNNLVSGLILAFERPVQVGDTIERGNLLGTVQTIGIRSSRVRTYDGAEVIVPNGHLISNEVINWTLSDQQRRIEVLVGVAYGTNVRTVLDLLRETAGSHEEVLSYPPPMALFQGFGDSSLNFRLLFWTGRFENWLQVKSEVATRVSEALKEAKIEIPFPQRDINFKNPITHHSDSPVQRQVQQEPEDAPTDS